MRKAYDWVIQFLGVVFITITVVPCVLGFLLFAVLFIGVNLLGWDLEPDGDARAVAALQNTGMTAYVDYAPYHAMVVDNSLSAFILPKYDNHTNKTDLRAGIMACVAELPNWHVEEFSCDKYAAKLNAVFTEAAFLLPADVTFDAWYEDAERLAFFDQDTGLMVHLHPGKQARAGRIKVDGLTVPHNGTVYEHDTIGGFPADGSVYQALIVPEDKRADFESVLSQHTDWHEGAIPQNEYAHMHRYTFDDMPALLPEPAVTFDWWLYVDDYAREYPEKEPDKDVHPHFPSVMQEAGAVFSLNWHIALYDADTGLFVYYELDC